MELLKDKIERWAFEENYLLKPLDKMKNQEFQLKLVISNLNFIIVKPKDQNYIFLETRMIFDKSLIALQFQKKDQLMDIFEEYKIYILPQVRVIFVPLVLNEKELIISALVFSTSKLYDEDLTKTFFFQSTDILEFAFLRTHSFFIHKLKNKEITPKSFSLDMSYT